MVERSKPSSGGAALAMRDALLPGGLFLTLQPAQPNHGDSTDTTELILHDGPDFDGSKEAIHIKIRAQILGESTSVQQSKDALQRAASFVLAEIDRIEKRKFKI